MNPQEILKFCLEKGLLLDGEVLEFLSETNDLESIKLIIEKIKSQTGTRVITKKLFNENSEKVSRFFFDLPEESRKQFEKLKIKLGLSIEISKEISKITEKETDAEKKFLQEKNFRVKINSLAPLLKKKPEVGDFVSHFNSRFSEMKNYLSIHPEMKSPISIDKISGSRQGISLIGMICNKITSKNNNIILEAEDPTGRIKVLVNKNKEEVYKKAEEVCLDCVIGIKASGNREIVFANDIIFPEIAVGERKKSPFEEYALFISDLHIGSRLFLEDNFKKFIDYLNGNLPDSEEAGKIRYLFIVGDLVAGVGVYPKQEKDLIVTNLEEQFLKAAELLKKIRKDIAIIISPGNHDGVRLTEPQPIFDEKYAWPVFGIENVFLSGNPSSVNLGAKGNFPGFDILTYHGFSFPFFANSIPSLIQADALNNPEKIMAYLLKNRHLAPTHASVQYIPSKEDSLVIRKTPDIFVTGHTHKSGASYYNNVLTISCSCWESKTPYQEKMGNQPDFCKVPMFNLKTRQIKILDFE